jgi:hypothetical protein
MRGDNLLAILLADLTRPIHSVLESRALVSFQSLEREEFLRSRDRPVSVVLGSSHASHDDHPPEALSPLSLTPLKALRLVCRTQRQFGSRAAMNASRRPSHKSAPDRGSRSDLRQTVSRKT